VPAEDDDDGVVDDLATLVFGLDGGRLTTGRTTRHITQAIGRWAVARGWSVRTEAPVAVGDAQLGATQAGFVDVVIRRGGSAPDIAIEIDSADKPWSVVKLQHAAAAGMRAVWIRWGDDEWAGVYEDVDVIQLRLSRAPERRTSQRGQLSFWENRPAKSR
jgi:hypothetical protein